MAALWRLVRAIFGHSRRAEDLEAGTVVPVAISAKKDAVVADPVPTFKPDLAGVPALVLLSMAVGATFAPEVPIGLKKAQFPEAQVVPIIVITPPPIDKPEVASDEIKKPTLKTPSDGDRPPLRSLTNLPRRVHGQTPRKTRPVEKENLRDHPRAPRLTHRRLTKPAPLPLNRLIAAGVAVTTPPESVKAAKPGSADWERQKAAQLQLARAWSDSVKARRQSLPAPPPAPSSPPLTRRASAPARLPLAERLRLAVAGCASLPPAPAPEPVVRPLWGDDHVSFVLEEDEEEGEQKETLARIPDTDHSFRFQSTSALTSESSLFASAYSSSSGSISSVLSAFEADLKSLAFLGLPQFAESGGESGGRSAGRMHGGKDYVEEGGAFDDSGDDHWSDVVSLEDYE